MESNIICDFCQQKTDYVPLPDVQALKIHYCQKCSTEYVYWSSDYAFCNRHIYATVHDKLYRWSVNSDKKAFLSYIKEPGVPGERPNKGVKLLNSFKEYPDITPQNIAAKIKTYLPFL